MKQVAIRGIGYDLAADLYETGSGYILLVLPGYTSTKLKYQDMMSPIVEATNYSALVLDYRGHGESPFELDDLTRADNFRDVITAFDWIKGNFPEKKIVVLGTSYGGFHAAYLTRFRSFDRLLLRVPASYPEETLYTTIGSMKDVHSDEYRNNPKNYKDHWLFKDVNNVAHGAFVITHELDTVCPPVATMPFVDAFSADHWEAPGFEHGLGMSEVSEEQISEYYQRISNWLLQSEEE